MNKTMTGAESLARGILDSGAGVLTSYPGGPVTGVVETALKGAKESGLYVEWSANEKVAFETALGCAATGVRAAVAAKHVGINHILDPLMTANLTGIRGGMVILAGDDPGSYNSQNEQDSRILGSFAEIPVLEPIDPQQGYDLVLTAFKLSEKIGLPVMVRFTADYTQGQGEVSTSPPAPRAQAELLERDRYKCLPEHVPSLHRELHRKMDLVAGAFDQPPYSSFNRISGRGPVGLVATGILGPTLRGLADLSGFRLLELATIHPLPHKTILDFLQELEEVYILEEVEPFVEDRIRIAAHKAGLKVKIKGKTTGHVPWEGDIDQAGLARFLAQELNLEPKAVPAEARDYPSLQPFGRGCPYSLFFSSMKKVAAELGQQRPIVVGETGCLVKLNNPPMESLELKFSMGASAGSAWGLRLSGLKNRIVAAMGDSVFFHTGINGVINAANAQADLIIVVMDNKTVALTGFQERMGSGRTTLGKATKPILPEDLARAMGIPSVTVLDAFDREKIELTWKECLQEKGLRFIVVRGECPYIDSKKCVID